jgi:hypothetical protein
LKGHVFHFLICVVGVSALSLSVFHKQGVSYNGTYLNEEQVRCDLRVRRRYKKKKTGALPAPSQAAHTRNPHRSKARTWRSLVHAYIRGRLARGRRGARGPADARTHELALAAEDARERQRRVRGQRRAAVERERKVGRVRERPLRAYDAQDVARGRVRGAAVGGQRLRRAEQGVGEAGTRTRART